MTSKKSPKGGATGSEEKAGGSEDLTPLMHTAMVYDQPYDSEEAKLDTDFFFFLTHTEPAYRNIQHEKDRANVEEWLKRIVGKSPETLAGKRNRNTYLAQLIMTMMDGNLAPPFNEAPPLGPLSPASVLFGGIAIREPCMEDLHIDAEDFAEVSGDGRTYLATKALPDNRGAFGYVAISTGGGDTLWVDTCGKSVNMSEHMRSHQSDLDPQTSNSLEGLMKERGSRQQRQALIEFYENVLSRICTAIATCDTDRESRDPGLDKMIDDLKNRMSEKAGWDQDLLQCYTKINWLRFLQKKFKCLLDQAEKRQRELDCLEDCLGLDDVAFLDMSKSIIPPKLDPMWAEAARDQPSEYNVNLLKAHYSDSVVCAVLCLLARERVNIINQEKSLHEELVGDMRADLLREVKQGLDKYAAARREWQKVANVMKRIDDARTRILQEVERGAAGADPDFQDKDSVLTAEIKLGKRKLDSAKEKSEMLEGRVTTGHEQVHRMAMEHERMEKEAKRVNCQMRTEVERLQQDVRTQERQILFLKNKLQAPESRKMHICD